MADTVGERTTITVSVDPVVHDYLVGLAKQGLFGSTPEEVAEYFLRSEVGMAIREGLLSKAQRDLEQIRALSEGDGK